MRILVKIGGAQIESDAGRADLARSVAAARAAHHEVILVHGGGNQIRQLGRRLGLADRYVDGLRVTDADTADVVLMVLGGSVNRALVLALQRRGLRAVGLTGADGGCFTARRYARKGQDLGFVGEIAAVDGRIVETLLAAAAVPVLATVAPLAAASPGSDRFHNINADQAAGPLAHALRVDALLFLTDVDGVLDERRQRIAVLSPGHADRLRQDGIIDGGMIPKVESALAAAAAAPNALVKIAPARGGDAVLQALSTEVGTTVTLAHSHG